MTIVNYTNLEDGDILLKIKNSHGYTEDEIPGIPGIGIFQTNGVFEIPLSTAIQHNMNSMSFIIIQRLTCTTELLGGFIKIKSKNKPIRYSSFKMIPNRLKTCLR